MGLKPHLTRGEASAEKFKVTRIARKLRFKPLSTRELWSKTPLNRIWPGLLPPNVTLQIVPRQKIKFCRFDGDEKYSFAGSAGEGLHFYRSNDDGRRRLQ